MTAEPLAERFRARSMSRLEGTAPLVVACSGGLDSTVLLHLLRFHAGLDPARLVVAHFDHRLRPESAADAEWAGGLARAWALTFRGGTAGAPPASEAEARTLRYAFLEQVRRDTGAAWIVTAHHADDQAETVLFRALRGTGLSGLAGIAPAGPHRRLRPLLPFWREELERHARAAGLGWRVDDSNVDRRYARNVIRHDLLPLAEREVAPGARAALVRLARNARREKAAWRSVEAGLLERVRVAAGEGRIVLDREGLRAYHPAVRARLLRSSVRALGGSLDEAGTRLAVVFTSRGASGQEVHLTGGVRLRRSFDVFELTRGSPLGAEGSTGLPEILIEGPGAGDAAPTGASGRWRSVWGAGRVEALGLDLHASLDPRAVAFPLRLRGWREGDRVRLAYGSKRVAKLLAEAGVPSWERASTWVLADRDGRILWVPGVARSVEAVPSTKDRDFHIGLEHADSE